MSASGKDTSLDDVPVADGTRSVLASAGIKRIVCVDDSFTETGSVDRAAIVAAVLSGEVAPSLMRSVAETALGEDVESYLAEDDDAEAQAQWLREHADQLTESMWAQLGGDAPEDRGRATTAQDPETLELLKNFSEQVGLEFFGLNLPAWLSRGEELLQQDGCSLIFFDRNMSNDGGAQDQGEVLLQATVNEYSPDKVIAVLFTHSISAEEEYSTWLTLANSNPGFGDRVLVIAKQRLRERTLDFASELKMAVLAPRLRRVAERIRTGFAEQASAAAERLSALSPHVLHTILVTTMIKEGSWGPDGLAAIAWASLRRRVEAYVRSDATVRGDASRLREMSLQSAHIVLPGGADDEYAEINRDQLFDDATHINQLRLPINTGDIFEFFDPGKELSQQSSSLLWIVVVQRCDLAVRSDGVRNYNPPLLPLARIAKPSNSSLVPVGAAAIGRIKFPAAPLAGHLASEVNLSQRFFVPSVALDACALNDDGLGRLVGGSDTPVEGLSPGWAVLAKHHAKWAAKRLDHYRGLSKGMPKIESTMERVLVDSVTGASKEVNGFIAKIDVVSKTILFGIRRVARLREPYAQDLMERVGALSSRIPLESAFEPDE